MLHDASTVAIFDLDSPPSSSSLAEETVPHIIILAKVGQKGVVNGDGARHKLTPDRSEASCGMQYHAGIDYFVPEALAGDLCQRGCFTAHEREKAEKIAQKVDQAPLLGEQERIPASEIGRQWIATPTPNHIPRMPRKKR